MGHAHSIRENPAQIIGIAALGAAIGAMAAMLFTPRTGSQARNGIKRRVLHGKEVMADKMRSKKEDMEDTMEGMKEKAKDKTTELSDEAKDKTGK